MNKRLPLFFCGLILALAASLAGQKSHSARSNFFTLDLESSLWSGATPLGQGEFWLDWFGTFSEADWGWIYHQEHGWQFAVGASTESFFLYDTALNAWIWTSDALYPWIYGFPPFDGWALYLRGGSPGIRWFFHTASGEWRREVPQGFSLIPAGTFAMGDHKNESEAGMARSRPVHDVFVSAFYMAQTPVTYGEWKEVYDWAVANGYTFDSAGGRGSDSSWFGLPDTPENNRHPVTRVSWYDVVKWCNAKSEREGRPPVYYTNDAQTTVYRQGRHDVTIAQVDWSADGYRLATDAEWEKAARGGLVGARWPWGDAEIDRTRANYWLSGAGIGTTPVDRYPPNGYALYDIAGNVQEWNWDWFSDTWYSHEGATEADTRGPVSGSDRVIRGGSWYGGSVGSRVAYRYRHSPDIQWVDFGFRLARNQ